MVGAAWVVEVASLEERERPGTWVVEVASLEERERPDAWVVEVASLVERERPDAWVVEVASLVERERPGTGSPLLRRAPSRGKPDTYVHVSSCGEVQEGRQAPPAGVWGVPKNFFPSPYAPPQAARKKGKTQK